MYTNINTYTYNNAHIHIQIFTHTNTHIHTYTDTHTGRYIDRKSEGTRELSIYVAL